MIRSCFTNLFASIGCLTVFVLCAIGGWYFRTDIADAYRAVVVRDRGVTDIPPTIGYPSEAGLRSAEAKEASLEGRNSLDSIRLTAGEMASLIEDRLTPEAKAALDSLAVILEPDRFSLDAVLKTETFGRDLLGPLRGMIDLQESLHVSGLAEVRAPGVIGWKIDEFIVASFPFPGPAIPVLVDRLTGGDGGVILVAIPTEVGRLQVRSDGVTFYRRAH